MIRLTRYVDTAYKLYLIQLTQDPVISAKQAFLTEPIIRPEDSMLASFTKIYDIITVLTVT